MQHDAQPSLSRSEANEIQYWQTHINTIGPERGAVESADLQKKHLPEVSPGYAIGKITGAKSLWNLSFYFKIVHQFTNQGPSLAPTHVPIWGTPQFPPPLGLVIKTDILWGNRDFFPFAKNRSTRFKSPYGSFFFLKQNLFCLSLSRTSTALIYTHYSRILPFRRKRGSWLFSS